MENMQRTSDWLNIFRNKYRSRTFARCCQLFLTLWMIEVFNLQSGEGLSAQPSWSVSFQGIGTFSSPRIADLNGDGAGDVIFGAGSNGVYDSHQPTVESPR